MSCARFIAEGLAVRTAAHLLHLSSASYAQHMALGEFYEGLGDLIDKYAEVCMGLEDRVKTWPTVPNPIDTPIDLLSDFLASVKEEMREDRGSQSLMNILAEIEELTARTLYKLRFLK